MKNLVILLPILLVMSSGCTTTYQVIHKNPETIIVNPGDRVKIETREKQTQTFRVIKVHPDKITGKKVELDFDEMKTLEVKRVGVKSTKYWRYYFADSLQELNENNLKVTTKDQNSIKFKNVMVEDSVIKGEDQTIGLSEIESIYVIIKKEPGVKKRRYKIIVKSLTSTKGESHEEKGLLFQTTDSTIQLAVYKKKTLTVNYPILVKNVERIRVKNRRGFWEIFGAGTITGVAIGIYVESISPLYGANAFLSVVVGMISGAIIGTSVNTKNFKIGGSVDNYLKIKPQLEKYKIQINQTLTAQKSTVDRN